MIRAKMASALIALQLFAGPAAAQRPDTAAAGAWLPATLWFAPLIADPAQPRNTAALIATDLLENTNDPAERPPFRLRGSAGSRDIEGAVGVGFSRPVLRLARWPGGGLDLGWMVGLFSRFRIEQPSRDQLSDDWYVGIPLTAARGPVSGRFRLLHHSSHMGDEAQEQGARRIEYSWEGMDALLAWAPAPHSRIYGGGTLVLRNNSYLLEDVPPLGPVPVLFTEHGAIQLGAETGWFGWAHGHAGVVGGVDWQAGDRADWRGQLSVVAGVEGHGAGHVGRILARCFRGPSMLGEFLLTRESYCGLEATFRF